MQIWNLSSFPFLNWLPKCIKSVQLSLHWSLNNLCHWSLNDRFLANNMAHLKKILNCNRQRIAGDMSNKPFEWLFKYKNSSVELWLQLFKIKTKKQQAFESLMEWAAIGCTSTRRIGRRCVLHPAVNGAMECVCAPHFTSIRKSWIYASSSSSYWIPSWAIQIG